MANVDHLKIIHKGVTSWNQWREEMPDIKPDLSFADLSKTDLSYIDLSRSNLTGINVQESVLIHADFSDSHVRNGNFTKTDLRYADFSRAMLRGATFKGADKLAATFTKKNIIDPKYIVEINPNFIKNQNPGIQLFILIAIVFSIAIVLGGVLRGCIWGDLAKETLFF